MRARDHEHGDGAFDGLVGGADRQPREERDDRGGGRDVEQERGGAVRERLRAGAGRLRFRDEPLDAGQRGVVTDRGDLDSDRGVGGDGAGHDPIACPLGDRARLTGDHRLVDLGLALDDLAVGRDARAGADEHKVVDRERRQRHGLDLPVGSTRSASSGNNSARAASAPSA